MIEFFKNKINGIVFVAVLWQLISVGLIGVGVWPLEVAILNTLLIAILIIVLPPVHSLGIFLLSLPFMIVLPNPWLENFPMWRPLAAIVFAVIAIRYLQNGIKSGNIRKYITQTWQEKVSRWDVIVWILFSFAAVSVVFARFPAHGFKQVLYVLNAYLVYIAARLVVSEATITVFLKYIKASLWITLGLGFVQYILTLFGEPYYFWQYWASMISSAYYGQSLADVLVYSNSWFSSDAGTRALRMFGILQDTHAFGVLAIFTLGLHLAFASVKTAGTTIKELLKQQTVKFWLLLIIICFAIVASGTRGIWIAMLAPLSLALFFGIYFRARVLSLLPLISYALVVVLFILSPFITMGLNFLRTVNQDDNFLNRASSIYDLSENSNAGRLEIWQSSVKYAITHPLGTGYGNFIVSLFPNTTSTNYDELANQENERYNLPEKFITAHSLYLHLLVELGILGLLLFVGLCLYLAWNILMRLMQGAFVLNPSNLLLFNLGLCIAWLLAYGVFDVTILNERVLLYMMVILAIIQSILTLKLEIKK